MIENALKWINPKSVVIGKRSEFSLPDTKNANKKNKSKGCVLTIEFDPRL